MKRVLITGMSGTGKSSVIRALAARGFNAVDTDDGWCEPLPGGHQRWREDAIEALLAGEDGRGGGHSEGGGYGEILFVAGCEENQVRFHPRFDAIILLSAPVETLLHRLATRTSNTFGKAPEELARILDDLTNIEPRLRRVATHEVQTTAPLADVVATILRLVGAPR